MRKVQCSFEVLHGEDVQMRYPWLFVTLCVAVLSPHPAYARTSKGGVENAGGAYAAVAPIERARPNPRLTPGAVDPRVTQANIRETICTRGYTKTVRPPQQFTNGLKVRQVRLYGYDDKRLRDYEEDHLVALEIGGSPDSARNLWPQPRHVIGNWGSLAKDKLENRLHSLVCRREIPLVQAQREMAHDWIAAYKRYLGPKAPARR
ncbi:hypothetical protein [Ralstonia soli]|uniref:Uncharacterized protein n=1 Tax=Ralstonia soli TaxID=2953896 RepID=A0ABT1AN63_9RALS|nr:hypothetical protein [Ralstonia soli]MCO5399736.1 hypothetical protein [Ralstonia soli]